MRYRITHKTDYRYANAVAQSNHLVHLAPRQTKGQLVESHELVISPRPASQRDFFDYFGNPTVHLTIEEDHNVLSIHAFSTIRVERDHAEAVENASASWETVRDLMRDPAHASEAEFSCYSGFTTPNHEIAEYGAQSFTPGRPLLDAVSELTSRIYTDFEYDGVVTDASTPVERVFEIMGGVCQDFAHLQLACLRAMGLPARYVSGYLRTYPPEGQPRLIGADASHAWISVWCPEAGWVDFDPTNNKVIADEHVTLTIGRDFEDISPISGIILGGGNHFVDVSVDVMPIDDNGNEIGASVDPEGAPAPAEQSQSQTSQTASQQPDLTRQNQQVQEQNQSVNAQSTQLQQAESASLSEDKDASETPPQPVTGDRTY
ncbi:Transglutaminase-like enzyme, putative cysteine protease [Cohaesibacter sp. ES.047]|uniref:transglutaminase family protein n=1 Tax=Cohaesibacter sp. ES.047 TaxID=1798205 RepID=UPI000BB8E62F|nr:transglutaminase family protein [Cohaesibacter sp. ES.047]SNY90009.1 Transglutaminase-like enzyme, putative cysteine protease [Cohaesibacter sp. ES.047]